MSTDIFNSTTKASSAVESAVESAGEGETMPGAAQWLKFALNPSQEAQKAQPVSGGESVLQRTAKVVDQGVLKIMESMRKRKSGCHITASESKVCQAFQALSKDHGGPDTTFCVYSTDGEHERVTDSPSQ